MRSLARYLYILPILAVGAAIFFPLLDMPPPPTTLRDYSVERGITETGAPNLVSAIYLSWRAYDTLGETIVLLLAVMGSIFLLEGRE
ncbi:MAG TPA: hydrogen gas-evolving membrane-bound hydrogenase subunit E [Magnetospirillaceae bacterium]|nr:hydrogen gas-evolving membrane-bound hydrogenase subunit E [Magnetospirillaceae bacterium]